MRQRKTTKSKEDIAEEVKILSIKRRYYDLGILDGMSASRVFLACELLSVSVEVLAAMINVAPGRLKAWIAKGKVPGYIAVLIYLLEKSGLSFSQDD